MGAIKLVFLPSTLQTSNAPNTQTTERENSSTPTDERADLAQRTRSNSKQRRKQLPEIRNKEDCKRKFDCQSANVARDLVSFSNWDLFVGNSITYNFTQLKTTNVKLVFKIIFCTCSFVLLFMPKYRKLIKKFYVNSYFQLQFVSVQVIKFQFNQKPRISLMNERSVNL